MNNANNAPAETETLADEVFDLIGTLAPLATTAAALYAQACEGNAPLSIYDDIYFIARRHQAIGGRYRRVLASKLDDATRERLADLYAAVEVDLYAARSRQDRVERDRLEGGW